MATSYLVCFNSGSNNQNNYEQGDNVSLISVNDSDQEYYQNGNIQLYNVPSTQTIGDTCRVWINDHLQFDGYVSRRQQTIDAGVKFWDYQLIGKTYDLWRYHTNSDTSYSGATSYIASSLVADFCTGMDADIKIGASDWSGTNLTEKIEFDNEIIGDALVRLIDMDGYRFYVDWDDNLQYYKPSQRTYDFTVTEANILEMTPIEDADEDIVNDVLVVGGTATYTDTTKQLSNNHPIYLTPGVFLAQRFKAENTRLTSIKLYLSRSLLDDKPVSMPFEIWSGNNCPSSMIEWSDDISWNAGNLPYAPSWSSWTGYTSPKLTLTSGSYYWMIFESPQIYESSSKFYFTGQSSGPNTWDSLTAKWSITDADGANYRPATGDNIYLRLGDWGGNVTSIAKKYLDSRLWDSDTGYLYSACRLKYAIKNYAGSDETMLFRYRTNAGQIGSIANPTPGQDLTGDKKINTGFAEVSSNFYLQAIATTIETTNVYGGLDNIRLYKVGPVNTYWALYYQSGTSYTDGMMRVSYDGKNHWYNNLSSNHVPSGSLAFQLAWSDTTTSISAVASNQTSIDTYGRHFKKITDSNITSETLAKVRATYEVSSLSVPKKGSITIEGREDMSVNYKFSSSLVNFGISDCWDVVSYTQTIDKRGFSTLINYGRQPFDFIKKISDLERSVY